LDTISAILGPGGFGLLRWSVHVYYFDHSQWWFECY